MVSQRRCAQLGLFFACFTLVIMLTVLFFGSYESASGNSRVGAAVNVAHDGDNTISTAKMTAMSK
jgi:hypothetical protein